MFGVDIAAKQTDARKRNQRYPGDNGEPIGDGPGSNAQKSHKGDVHDISGRGRRRFKRQRAIGEKRKAHSHAKSHKITQCLIGLDHPEHGEKYCPMYCCVNHADSDVFEKGLVHKINPKNSRGRSYHLPALWQPGPTLLWSNLHTGVRVTPVNTGIRWSLSRLITLRAGGLFGALMAANGGGDKAKALAKTLGKT